MKLGFFTKLYYAITDFRLYPYVVQKEKLKDAFWYFFSFIFLICIILSATTMIKVTNWLNEFVTEYHEQVNDFEIKDGELTVNKNMNVDFLRVKIYTDDNRKMNDVDLRLLDLDNYKVCILAFKDEFAIGSQKYGYISANYKESNINIDKQGTYNLLSTALKTPIDRILFMVVLFVSLLITFLITRFIYGLFIAIMLMLLALLFRLKYSFREYLKVAFYVLTLPTIIEVIAIICVGELNDYATITYYLLCYVYIFYAVRALKLDNILMTTQEKMMSIKSEAEKANSILGQEKDSKVEQDEPKENEEEKQGKSQVEGQNKEDESNNQSK